jgi:hypothetical protein
VVRSDSGFFRGLISLPHTRMIFKLSRSLRKYSSFPAPIFEHPPLRGKGSCTLARSREIPRKYAREIPMFKQSLERTPCKRGMGSTHRSRYVGNLLAICRTTGGKDSPVQGRGKQILSNYKLAGQPRKPHNDQRPLPPPLSESENPSHHALSSCVPINSGLAK